ncbi:MAG: AEC family transporter [Myxococcales bacterium]|nr:AEC family transporter [Myxococcales bacterium]
MVPSLLTILVPLACGVVAGLLRLFADADAAVAYVNRYPLYFAFPALVLGGIAGGDFEVPTEVAFWVLPAVLLAALAGLAWLCGRTRTLGAHAGPIALAGMFGNVAYLGLPVVESVLGERVLGRASLLSSLLLGGSLAAGPYLLARWSGGTAPPGTVRRLLGQPLLWAPVVGLAARLVPAAAREPVLAALAPVGKSAGPVALFALGLFLYARRAALRQLGAADVVAVGLRLVVAPGLALALAVPAVALGWLSVETARIAVLLAGMPTGVTAFALATELRLGEEALARAVVASTVAAALVVPVLAWVVMRL